MHIKSMFHPATVGAKLLVTNYEVDRTQAPGALPMPGRDGRMSPRTFLLLAVSILLVGCSGVSTPRKATENASPAATHTPRATTATLTITSTPTYRLATVGTPSPIPTASALLIITPKRTITPQKSITSTILHSSPTSLQGTGIVRDCLSMKDYQDSDFIVEGKLIRRCLEGACVLDFQNPEIHETGITPTNLVLAHSRVFISPDLEWLAYEEVTLDSAGNVQSSRLRIVSADGQERSVKRWDAQWRLAGWYDNDRISVEAPNGAEKTNLILNLSTGETEEILLPVLRNPYQGDLLLSGPEPNYDPTYSKVAYLYVNTESGMVNFALWGIKDDKLLWQGVAGNEMLYGTKWSSDEQHIAVASEVELNKAELFSVSAGGQETQLTDFEAAYPSMNITIGSFDWSPDGRYISLWLNVRPGEYLQEWRFAVLDVQTKQVTDYCITTSLNMPADAIWSPSSQLLAVPLFSNTNVGDNYSFMLLDIRSNIAVKVKLPGMYGLLGWMVSP